MSREYYVRSSSYNTVDVAVEVESSAPQYYSSSNHVSLSESKPASARYVSSQDYSLSDINVDVSSQVSIRDTVRVLTDVSSGAKTSNRYVSVATYDVSDTNIYVDCQLAQYLSSVIQRKIDSSVPLQARTSGVQDVRSNVEAEVEEATAPIYIYSVEVLGVSETGVQQGAPPQRAQQQPAERENVAKAEFTGHTWGRGLSGVNALPPSVYVELTSQVKSMLVNIGVRDVDAIVDPVESLLRASASGDVNAVASNPVFRMAVKLLEIKPLVDDKTYESFLSKSGVSNIESVLYKLANGYYLTPEDYNTLINLSFLYRDYWAKLGRTGTLALDVGLGDKLRKYEPLARQFNTPIHSLPLDIISKDIVDEYYLKVLESAKTRKLPQYREEFARDTELRKSIAEALGKIDVLGNISQFISNSVYNALKDKVGEKVALTISSAIAGAVASAGLGLATVATGGALAPFIMGAVAVTSARALADMGLQLDNPIEAELFEKALRENWPAIAAAVAASIAGGYAGAKLGSIVFNKATLPTLEKMYVLAKEKGYTGLAEKIGTKLRDYLSARGVSTRLDAGNHSYQIVVDEEGDVATIRVFVSGRGDWKVTDVYSTVVKDARGIARNPDFMTLVFQKTIGKGLSVDDASKVISNLASSLPDDFVLTPSTLEMLGNILDDSKILQLAKAGKLVVKAVSDNSAVCDVGSDLLVFFRAGRGISTANYVSLPKNVARSLPLYMSLKENGIDPNDLFALFKKAAASDEWVGRIGGFDVIYKNQNLIIAKAGSKLAEFTGVTREIIDDMPAVESFVSNLLKMGGDMGALKTIARALTPVTPVPGTVTAESAVPLAKFLSELQKAVDSSRAGIGGEKVTRVVTDKGVVEAQSTVWVSKDISGHSDVLKLLEYDDIRNVARKLVEGNIIGRGEVKATYVIRVPKDVSGKVIEALNKALGSPGSPAGGGTSTPSAGTMPGNVAGASAAGATSGAQSSAGSQAASMMSRSLLEIQAVAGKEVADQVAQVYNEIARSMSAATSMDIIIPFAVSTARDIIIPVVITSAMLGGSQAVASIAQSTQLGNIAPQSISDSSTRQLIKQYVYFTGTNIELVTVEQVLEGTLPLFITMHGHGFIPDKRRIYPFIRDMSRMDFQDQGEDVEQSIPVYIAVPIRTGIPKRSGIGIVPVPQVLVDEQPVDEEKEIGVYLTMRFNIPDAIRQEFTVPVVTVEAVIMIPIIPPGSVPVTPPPPETPQPVPAGAYPPLVPRLEFTEGPVSAREYVGRLVGEIVVI